MITKMVANFTKCNFSTVNVGLPSEIVKLESI